MGEMILLDSNILIYATSPHYPKVTAYLEDNMHAISVSWVTLLEVLGYHKITTSAKQLLEELTKPIVQYPITYPILQKAIVLRQAKSISMGDALIAATALEQNMPLLTNNVKDYKHISGLVIKDMQQFFS